MSAVSIELGITAVVEIRGRPREDNADHHKCLLLLRLAADCQILTK